MILPPLKNGFTLVELSTVVVIIGLLVGGIMVGRDLIRTSEIRSQIKQFEEITSATNAFKVKYGYMPGDIPPTETTQLGFFTFTGTYAGKAYLVLESVGNYIKYGFGNGSGEINEGEILAFWQHLSEAKMITGQYGTGTGTVIQSSTNSYFFAGLPTGSYDYDVFLPKSKFSGRYPHLQVIQNQDYTQIRLFTETSLSNLFYINATTNQEYAIDSKIDDGIPDTGRVRNMLVANTPYYGSGYLNGHSASCTIAASPNTYNLSATVADTPNICTLAVLW